MGKFFYSLECLLREKISRSTFLKICLGWFLVFLAENRFLKLAFAEVSPAKPRAPKTITAKQDLVSVSGPDAYKNTVAAVEALGGMALFVKKGDVVVVKPNIGWDRTPDQAANTDPEVVAALVEMAYQAGAKRVNVFDVTCNDPRLCYENSGIQAAVKAKGGQIYLADSWNVVKANFPYASSMEGWTLLRDAVVCDTFINVPVLKHHGLTGLTLSMKNLMGICTGMRGMMHLDIGKKLVDITDFIKPELTVIDATRVLTRNGPSGGNVADVVRMDTVIASPHPVLADTFACRMVSIDPLSVSYLQAASARNFGKMDIDKSQIQTIKL